MAFQWQPVVPGTEPAPDPVAAYAAALLAERAGYERRGLPDRVAQVDAELARIGWGQDAEGDTNITGDEDGDTEPTPPDDEPVADEPVEDDPAPADENPPIPARGRKQKEQ